MVDQNDFLCTPLNHLFLPLFPAGFLKYDSYGYICMTLKLARVEIEKLVDKVLKDNPDTVRSFRNPKKRDFAHCYLGGSVCEHIISSLRSLIFYILECNKFIFWTNVA